MSDPRTDRIAREAARLLGLGRAASMHDAVQLAVESLGMRGAPLPGHGRVRRHAQAMSMQAMGEAAYIESQREVWRIAEELMTALEQVVPDARCLLMGRAAAGHIDAGVTIHLRLFTGAAVSDIAASLVQFGYEEPSFTTADTPRGRFSQIRLVEDGREIVITRCPPEANAPANQDLFTARPLESLTLSELRERMET